LPSMNPISKGPTGSNLSVWQTQAHLFSKKKQTKLKKDDKPRPTCTRTPSPDANSAGPLRSRTTGDSESRSSELAMSSALAAGGGAAAADGAPEAATAPTRREKRRERKKERRLLEIQEAEAAAESERARRAFEDAERRWLEAAAARAAEKAAAAAAEEEARAAEASARKEVISPRPFHNFLAPSTEILCLAISQSTHPFSAAGMSVLG